MSGQIALGDLQNPTKLTDLLRRDGFSESAVAGKAELFAAAARTLIKAGRSADSPARAFFVPGRIEVLGKHTDYAGGRSLLAAAEKGFCTVAVERDDRQVTVRADEAEDLAEFALDGELQPTIGHWSNYPMTVARRLARNFPSVLRGADLAFRNDLPPAAGMSSSSAMMISNYLVLAAINNLPDRPEYRENIDGTESLAGYLGTIENGQSFGSLAGDKGVGTFGGSQDHTAILCCGPEQLSLYSFCPVRLEKRVPMPKQYVFVVAASGVIAEKTGSAREKFNRASGLARAAAQAWNKATGRDDAHLAAAVAAAGGADPIRNALAEAKCDDWPAADLLQRFEHFYAESMEIIPAAAEALAGGDIAQFARQVDRSQELTETLLCNQVEETIFLASSARELGAAAASAFGAGFGGSVWALVEETSATDFASRWSEQYRQKFPAPAQRARYLTTHPGPAAFQL